MNLLEKTANVVSFNLIQTFTTKILAAVQFAILLRLLPTADIGVYGLVAGYIGMLGLFAIAPETIFLRDFVKYKDRLAEHVSAFTVFGLVRGFVTLGVGVPLTLFIATVQPHPHLVPYFLLAILAFSISLLTGPFREAFYGNFRQGRITLVDLVSSGVSLAGMIFLYYSRDLVSFGLIQVGVAVFGLAWWYWNAKKHLGFSWKLLPGWWGDSLRALSHFSFWNQLTSVALRVAYQADIIILGFFAGLSTLGDYTVALTLANVFFVIPQLVQKAGILSFSRVEEKHSLRRGLGTMIRYNTILVLGQFLGFVVLGQWLIAFFGPENPDVVWLYSLYLVGGVTLFSLARPWVAILIAKVDAKELFGKLFVWFAVLSAVVYVPVTHVYGVVGLAQANVGLYLLLGLLAAGFATFKLALWPDFSMSDAEKKWLSNVRKGDMGIINLNWGKKV
ncbi:MAG: oligosaccharide flippase family protein [archaeon]